MGKTLPLLLGALALGSLTGCDAHKGEFFRGEFRNMNVLASRALQGPERRVLLTSPDFYLMTPVHTIHGTDNDGDGVFETIIFDGYDMDSLGPAREGLANPWVFRYAVSDSLNEAYHYALIQDQNPEVKLFK